MRVPMAWLKEYVDLDLSPAGLAEKLTMAGIAVEGMEDLAAPYNGIVAGRIISLKPHPGADRLLLAETDWGQGPRTLVTGAKNLKPGDLVPVAPPGVTLPNGKTIAEAVFAGVRSEGMLCSGAELGLEKTSEGILILAGDWAPGTPAAKALGLDDVVLELELTPNRADCLGLLGVAREVAALTGAALRLPQGVPAGRGPAIADLAKVRVEDPDLCPRYGGKVFLNVRIGPSPAWMQSRLRAAGVRPINNIVDVTNYVMLEMNQPLHAFDLDRLAERTIIVRRARAGESLVTLDGTTRELPPGTLVIADPAGPVAVAGVMGGADSEVAPETTRVFLEGACFERTGIRRTAKALAMRTEASLRMERGIDPAGTIAALERAARLVEEIGAGEVAAGTIDVAAGDWPPRRVEFRPNRINAILGTELAPEEIAAYLGRLGFAVERLCDGTMAATVPTHRLDIEGLVDLAEEVARLHGYDRIPTTYPKSAQVGRRTPEQSFTARARQLLLGLGQTEVITYSFCSPKLFDRLGLAADDPRRNAPRIMAPLSEEWSLMRPTLLGGILDVLALNARRGADAAQLFEIAHIYLPVPGEELPRQPLILAGVMSGLLRPRSWAEQGRNVDFYDLKGLLETFLQGLGVADALEFAPGRHPSMHPGRTAVLRDSNGQILGHLGEAHPRVVAAYDLRGPVCLYELEIERLYGLRREGEARVQSPPRFPAVQRDLALVVPVRTNLAELESAIRDLAGGFLAELELFDVFTGSQIGEGRKSMAFSLVFRAADRTLTDAEVNAAMERLLAGLGERFGAVVR